MGLVDQFNSFTKKLESNKNKRMKDKFARGLDIKNYLTSWHPSDIDNEKYRDGWERTFGKKSDKKEEGVSVSGASETRP